MAKGTDREGANSYLRHSILIQGFQDGGFLDKGYLDFKVISLAPNRVRNRKVRVTFTFIFVFKDSYLSLLSAICAWNLELLRVRKSHVSTLLIERVFNYKMPISDF